MGPLAIPAIGLGVLDALSSANAKQPKLNPQGLDKAKSTSQDFEAVFLNSMFSQMFTGLEGEGPMGGNGASGVWRSFLTDEYSKTFAKAGGVGIAKQVYSELIARQASQSWNPQAHPSFVPIASLGEAQHVIANLERIMDSLLETVEAETALVRGGKIAEAARLEEAKAELSGRYLAETQRLKANKDFVQRNLPHAIDALRRRHDSFHALLQINLTVLATAHAVSEGIVRGVSDEINRAQVPQTYGASGRAIIAKPKNRQPMAISRTL